MNSYQSWGGYPIVSQTAVTAPWRFEKLPAQKNILPYGLGKSYGDACLNNEGSVIKTTQLNHFISFNPDTGVIACEVGVTLAEILQLVIPHGWFLPVTPGLKYITVGGAIGNDVHGKNHHRAGTFGHHLLRFELLRSDGSRLICSPQEHADLFQATIGGIGLTGLITWAEFSLRRISSVYLNAEQVVTNNFDEVLELFASSQDKYEYVIASIDSSASGNKTGCGYFLRGNHEETTKDLENVFQVPKITIPTALPISLLTPLAISVFNKTYYHRQIKKSVASRMHYNPFFYPQDIVGNWNYFYGPTGFIQYQCQLPPHTAKQALYDIFSTIQKAGIASPLTTLKLLGNKPSLGLLSFPREGYTLALDFPNTGKPLLKTLEELDVITKEAGGSIYLAKDARMSSAMFQHSYPKWQEFAKHVDPAFSSSMWRRLTKT